MGALALHPTGNAQGSFYFISLSTGRLLNQLRATPLPMPNEVVDRVHRMARQQKADPGLLFGDRNMNQDDDQSMDSDSSEDDEDFTPYQDDHDEQTEPDDDSTKADHDEGGDGDAAVPEMSDDEETQMSLGDRAPGTVSSKIEDDRHIPASMMEDDEHLETMDQEIQGVGDDGDDEQINGEWDPHMVVPLSETKTDNDYEAVRGVEGSPRYNLPKNRAHDYGHAYDPEVYEVGKASPEEAKDTVLTTVDEGPEDTPQMSMKKGLQAFGEGGYAAVKQEMQQLHDRKVMQPIRHKDLTPEQKRDALGYLMFLKKKRCGKIKGRGCADGRKQHAYITKEQSTSPTISTEAVFLTALVDAWENRKVAVLDVPGAFMQVDMDELVHVKFRGEMVDKLLEIDPELYSSYISEERGEKVMYVELLKALYGTLRAARFFWEKLHGKLVNEWGFVPNRYDSCVVNKMVNGKQLTVAWHVDDLKVSHVEESALEDFIAMMEEEFGTDAPLSVSRGPVQEYLGMTMDFSEKGRVVIKMSDYVKTMLHDAPPPPPPHQWMARQ